MQEKGGMGRGAHVRKRESESERGAAREERLGRKRERDISRGFPRWEVE